MFSFVFAPGTRPDLAALIAAGSADQPFAGFMAIVPGMPETGADASSQPAPGWTELLTQGLAFDCAGLAPGAAGEMPAAGLRIGFEGEMAGETVTLEPGPHLAEGAMLLPVLRAMTGIAARLAALPGLRAICWEPARCWTDPAYFSRVAGDWLAGGAFPALGLTALERERNGAVVSVGLGFLIGQELRLEPDRKMEPAAAAQLAVRLIHRLVESGAVTETTELAGPAGERLVAVPVYEGRQLRVMRR